MNVEHDDAIFIDGETTEINSIFKSKDEFFNSNEHIVKESKDIYSSDLENEYTEKFKTIQINDNTYTLSTIYKFHPEESSYREEWYKNGNLHRDGDLPAVYEEVIDSIDSRLNEKKIEYYYNGELYTPASLGENMEEINISPENIKPLVERVRNEHKKFKQLESKDTYQSSLHKRFAKEDIRQLVIGTNIKNPFSKLDEMLRDTFDELRKQHKPDLYERHSKEKSLQNSLSNNVGLS